MPTIEEVATRLTKAKTFAVVDAKEWLWQIRLDKESSYKTTFNNPFGRFRLNRLSYGICSAAEVWQRTMHEFVENLEGVEVIADDFLIAGFGETEPEVLRRLDANERAFFDRCHQWNLKLNPQKVKRCQTTVDYMAHLLTPEGSMPDPEKIKAILEMSEPKDVTALKRLLVMVNYMSTFLSLLSDMTEPLRRLDERIIELEWTNAHAVAMNTLRQSLTEAPVQMYYDVMVPVTVQCNVMVPVTVQCDVSQSGLGAVLLQHSNLVACQTLKCFCDLPTGLPSLPHGFLVFALEGRCVATRESMKYWQRS